MRQQLSVRFFFQPAIARTALVAPRLAPFASAATSVQASKHQLHNRLKRTVRARPSQLEPLAYTNNIITRSRASFAQISDIVSAETLSANMLNNVTASTGFDYTIT